MAFDLSTARPVTQGQQAPIKKGFDLSTARPIYSAAAAIPADQDVPIIGADGHAVVQMPQQQPEPSIGQQIVGAGETGLSLLTGATTGVAGAVGGAARGLGHAVLDGNFGTQTGANNIAKSAAKGMQDMTYAPKTQAGKEQLQAVGDAMAPLAAFAPMSGEMSALASGMKQVAPALRDLPKAVIGDSENRMPLTRVPPSLVEEGGALSKPFIKALNDNGVDLVNVVDDLKRLPSDISPQRAAKELVLLKLRTKDRDGYLATKQLLPGGTIADDTLAQEAVRQGFREGDVQAVKVASDGTKQAMRRMLDIKRKIYGNEREALDSRPSDVIGESTLKRYEYISKNADAARSELNKIANNNLSGKQINADQVRQNLFDELDKLDVDVDTSTIPPKVNYAGSRISKDRTSQKVINDVIDLLGENKTPDALRAHKLKQQLDTMIDYRNKQSQGGLTVAGENVAKSVRRSLNESIREVSSEYAAVNDTLSKSLDAMNNFKNTLGSSIDISSPNAKQAIGQDLRGLMSNRKTRVKLENSLSQIDDTAHELGGSFSDDIRDLVLFDKTLDEKFGATARRGFSGEVESAVGRVMQGKEGIKQMVIDAASKKFNEMRNINDHQAFSTLDKLITRKN